MTAIHGFAVYCLPMPAAAPKGGILLFPYVFHTPTDSSTPEPLRRENNSTPTYGGTAERESLHETSKLWISALLLWIMSADWG
jgi:hypothetical protein